MEITLSIKSQADMSRFAEMVAESAVKVGPGPESATVIGLVGDLGAGKTAFTKSFLKVLGIKERVTSPTFVIMRSFRMKRAGFNLAHHIDAYRVSSGELTSLGLKAMLGERRNILVIEWADRIKKILPKGTIWIKISHGKNEKERTIKIS